MRGRFKGLMKDTFIKYSLILSIVLTLITAAFILPFYGKLPPYIPFLKSMPWGEERLAGYNFIFFFPIASILVVLINNLLSSLIYSKYALIARILSANGLLFSILSLISLLQIILLIF